MRLASCQFPLNGLRAQSKVSPVVWLLPLASGLLKQGTPEELTAAEMKYMRRTAGYTWTDYKTNAQITQYLKMTPTLDKLLECKRKWIQHVNRMPRNTRRLPRVIKHYFPTGRKNNGRLLKRLLDTWDRNRSTSGPTAWDIWLLLLLLLLLLLSLS